MGSDLLICLKSTQVFECESRRASQGALVVKNPPANAGDGRDAGSIPGSGRSPGGGHGNPPQYSCPEHPMDGGAWRPQPIGSQSWTLKPASTCTREHHTRGSCASCSVPTSEGAQETQQQCRLDFTDARVAGSKYPQVAGSHRRPVLSFGKAAFFFFFFE